MTHHCLVNAFFYLIRMNQDGSPRKTPPLRKLNTTSNLQKRIFKWIKRFISWCKKQDKMLICKSSEKHFQFHASRSPRWNLGNSSVICKDHKFECNPIVMQAKNKVAWDQAPQWRKTCGIWSQAMSKVSTVFLIIDRQGVLTYTIYTNQLGGNLVLKHKTIKFEVAGERSDQINWIN